MIFLNIFLLAIAIGGLLLFAYGLQKKQKLSVLFGAVIILAPLIYLTVGVEFIAGAPIIGLLIMYYFSGMDDGM